MIYICNKIAVYKNKITVLFIFLYHIITTINIVKRK